MLFDITIPEIPIIITLEPQNSAYVYLGHRSENRTLFPSILSKIRIYSGQKSPENEKYPKKLFGDEGAMPLFLFLFYLI